MLKSLLNQIILSAYINGMSEKLFQSDISRTESKALFRRYVHDVELENHSFCNRVCWFCPNSFIERRKNNKFMSDAVFGKVIGNLSELDYDQTLEWSGYAEHFAYEAFLDRLQEARRALPKAKLTVFSNGDYLSREMVDRVLSMGVMIHVDIYPPEGDEFNEDKIASAISKFVQRTKLKVVAKDRRTKGWGDYAILNESGQNISSLKVGRYSTENIFTRGGAMDIPKRKTYRRTAICLKPAFHLNVNYDGKGMLCCHTRSDFHTDAVIADLNQDDEDLFSYFARLGPARKHLLAPGPKGGVCTTCDDGDNLPGGLLARTPLATAAALGIKRLLGRV